MKNIKGKKCCIHQPLTLTLLWETTTLDYVHEQPFSKENGL